MLALSFLVVAGLAFAGPTDPGVRAGPANAGGPLEGIAESALNSFWQGWQRFKQAYSVSGDLERGVGLGPAFNALSCAQCHAQPSAGGASSSPSSPQVRRVVMRDGHTVLERQPNPLIALASLHRVPDFEQQVPGFISADGPVLVARFIRTPQGSPDGAVHPAFTIAGRVDAPRCAMQPPDFSAELARHNVVFRVPTLLFGAGLIESVRDAALEANLRASADERRAMGIAGRFNRTADGQSIGRFGWKAQTASLARFAAESQNVEIGVTNQYFPAKRATAPGCTWEAPKADPSDVDHFVAFMRFSAPPAATTSTPSEQRGQALFAATGCSLCHSETLRTRATGAPGLSGATIHPYSDFALHHMGPGLADHVSQGLAGGDEFRTAPLWGLGQRIFFLHDGRTTDLLEAVEVHASAAAACPATPDAPPGQEACASEADAVIARFNGLPKTARSDLLAFLRSL